ncbi:MAG: hypothetical protein NTZ83_04135 [Candidatus Pacearchaeota archaeon]|nr:hypothetical protein [Candidatus Pacearchaeota archaeon]
MAKTENNKLTKKIKILRGLEKACIVGVVVGLGLALTGKPKETTKANKVGIGIAIASVIGRAYTANKRVSLAYQDYLDKERQRFDDEEKIDYYAPSNTQSNTLLNNYKSNNN